MMKKPTKGLSKQEVKDARRLLCRLDERAKTSGEMPEQIQIGMRPLAEKGTGAAYEGPPGAPVQFACRGRMRQGLKLEPANDNCRLWLREAE